MLWYVSRDSPPQDLKQRELTFQSPVSRETEKEEEKKEEGNRNIEKKGEMKTGRWEGEKERRRKDKVSDVDKNDENVRVLAQFLRGSKTRGKGTISDGREEEEEEKREEDGIVGGGEVKIQ